MKFLSVLFLLFVLLTSCSKLSGKKSNHDELIDQSLKTSAEFLSQRSSLSLNLIERQYNINHNKVKDFYHLSRTIDSIFFIFQKTCNSSKSDNVSKNELITKYKNTIDLINNQLTEEHYKPVWIIGNDKLISDFQALDFEELKYILVSELTIGEMEILNYIFTLTHSYDWKFDRIELTTEKSTDLKNNYSFTINSKYLQQIVGEDRITTIDTIMKNGIITNAIFSTVPIEAFELVTMDSLDIGHYYISGKTKFIMDNGKLFLYPFHHEFDIE